MLRYVHSDSAQARALGILKSIPGIGAMTAVAVLAEMPEIGSLDPKAAASLAGLAPVTRQSGNWQRAGWPPKAAQGPLHASCLGDLM